MSPHTNFHAPRTSLSGRIQIGHKSGCCGGYTGCCGGYTGCCRGYTGCCGGYTELVWV